MSVIKENVAEIHALTTAIYSEYEMSYIQSQSPKLS
jgi:hypothetical protein